MGLVQPNRDRTQLNQPHSVGTGFSGVYVLVFMYFSEHVCVVLLNLKFPFARMTKKGVCVYRVLEFEYVIVCVMCRRSYALSNLQTLTCSV